ncbi:MAG: GPW/gp25 family protein [Sediminibacterium sp.]|nr:GPW/gp25 family protein [Sediminibacterium sp.]
MKPEEDFLGTGWSFPPRFEKAGSGIVMVSDEEDIRQSLTILFNTSSGERIMRPEYGCNIRSFLFRSIDNSFQNYMKDTIINAILKYESRIIVNDLLIDTSAYTDGIVVLDLTYTIRTTNNRNNMVFPFYLNEGTLINQ